jgi:S1-C subfamily serine protease
VLTATSQVPHGWTTAGGSVMVGMASMNTESVPELRRPDRRRLHAGALAAVGGLLAAVMGWSVTNAVNPGSSTTSGSDQVQAQTVDGPGQYSGPHGGAGIDADRATDEESVGVVLIETLIGTGDGEERLGAGAGTGIVLTADGQVLTNYHVVESSADIQVTLASTGDTYEAEVIGASERADIALLQLRDADGLEVATLDDDTLALGDEVTAVGNAGGTGELTAADGTVTDLESQITVSSYGERTTLTNVIETDADVQSGESGGPLIDGEGEVVGVTTAASAGRQINGYAVPIDDALVVVEQIRSGKETSTVRIGASAFLGVRLASGPSGGLDDERGGALIDGVTTGGPAAEAGLRAGDTVIRIGSAEISNSEELREAIVALEPGQKVTLTWITAAGSTESGSATLAASAVA